MEIHKQLTELEQLFGKANSFWVGRRKRGTIARDFAAVMHELREAEKAAIWLDSHASRSRVETTIDAAPMLPSLAEVSIDDIEGLSDSTELPSAHDGDEYLEELPQVDATATRETVRFDDDLEELPEVDE
jgi:hypothetical protein